MQFGFTLKPEHTIERTLALTRQAEAAGFEYGWLFDSHVLWRDPYPLLTLMAGATERLRLGTCVTNPGTREPSVTASALATLDEISGGRMDLGIGRGDSARRVLGKPPITMPTPRRRSGSSGRSSPASRSTTRARSCTFPWTRGWTLPVWVAGYGPMALAMTGRVADGVILQLADPDLIRWFVGQVREAATAAGRDPASLQVQAAAPAHVGPRELGRERTRWFPALVSNHVVDLVNKYPREQLPESLTGYIRDRTGYDYHHHAEVGSSNAAFVGDEVTDRFCVLGSVDEHIAKLRELADAGVDQFNIYLMNGDEETAARGVRHGRHPGLPLTVGRRDGRLPDEAGHWPRMSGWSAVPDLGDDGRSRRTVPPPCRDPHRRSGWPPDSIAGRDPFWDDGRRCPPPQHGPAHGSRRSPSSSRSPLAASPPRCGCAR